MSASKYTDIDGTMADEYRTAKLREVEEKITADIKRHAKLLSKYKKHCKIVQMMCHFCNFVNVLSAGGAVGSSGVGLLPAVIPCATITGIATLTNATLHVLEKKIETNKKKHSEIMVLAQRTKNRLQKVVSRNTDDDVLDVSEFEEIMNLESNYEDQKQKVVNKFCKK